MTDQYGATPEAPLNAPQAAALGIGVQPGTTPGLVLATLVIVSGGTGSGIFVYSPTPGLNNLIASITAAAGTDQYGNAYDGGVSSYGTGIGGSGAQVSQLLAGALFLGLPGQFPYGTQTSLPAVIAVGNTGGPGTQGTLTIQSGNTALSDPVMEVDLNSKANSGYGAPTGEIFGGLVLVGPPSGPANPTSVTGRGPVLFASSNGFPRFLPSSTNGDTVSYQAGHAIFRNTADQTGIGTSATVIAGLSANLGVGLYNFRGMISLANPTGATITPNVGFQASGGLVAANLDVGMEWYSSTVGSFKGCGKVSALGNGVSPTSGQAAAEVVYVKFDGVINVSTKGTLQVFALGTAVNLTVKAFSRIVHWPDN